MINLKGNDTIAAVAKVMHDEEEVDIVENDDIIADSEDGTTLDNLDTDSNQNENNSDN